MDEPELRKIIVDMIDVFYKHVNMSGDSKKYRYYLDDVFATEADLLLKSILAIVEDKSD